MCFFPAAESRSNVQHQKILQKTPIAIKGLAKDLLQPFTDAEYKANADCFAEKETKTRIAQVCLTPFISLSPPPPRVPRN